MQLIPFEPEVPDADADNSVRLTGIEGSGGNREQILEALRLNRHILYTPQPDATVDEAAVRATIDDLLDQLDDTAET